MLTAAAVEALPGPDWLAERRAAAFETYTATPFPTDAEEIWRYSRIGDLKLADYSPATVGAPAPQSLPPLAERLLEAIGPRSALIVTHQGAVVRLEADEPDAVIVGGVGHPMARELLAATAGPSDAIGALALAFALDAAVVTAEAPVELPVVVVHVVGGASAGTGGLKPAVFPRTVVRAGSRAELTVIECVVSYGSSAFVAPVSELQVADGGRLRFLSAQHLGREVFETAHQASVVGRDARLTSFTASLGGSYARSRNDSRLVGPGGETELLAAFFGDGEQMHDFRTLQEHAAPRTTSDLLFKGAVAGKARSVYSGLIRIEPGAKGSNAFQTNRNLVLSEGAHADSVPNLDIKENDVRCSHASAVGPIDPDQRFYLESRGVPAPVAERLILLGFFDDLFARLLAPGLRAHLAAEIAARLELAGERA